MGLLTYKVTTHPTVAVQTGPIEIETITTDWRADLSGLLNLKHPKAVAAGLSDRKEPIKIFTHIVRHPNRGPFLIDSGVSRMFIDQPAEVGVGWVLRKFFGIAEMKPSLSTKEIIAREETPLKGVFMTHLHLDHIAGLPDISKDVLLYIGPQEAELLTFINIIAQGTNDRLLHGRPLLQELEIAKDEDETFAGILDIFEDQSLFAIHTPGHTVGHLAFIARTTTGSVLLTGDVSHTRWGWDEEVEPGTYTELPHPGRDSLSALKRLSERHPHMTVKLGHQD